MGFARCVEGQKTLVPLKGCDRLSWALRADAHRWTLAAGCASCMGPV